MQGVRFRPSPPRNIPKSVIQNPTADPFPAVLLDWFAAVDGRVEVGLVDQSGRILPLCD